MSKCGWWMRLTKGEGEDHVGPWGQDKGLQPSKGKPLVDCQHGWNVARPWPLCAKWHLVGMSVKHGEQRGRYPCSSEQRERLVLGVVVLENGVNTKFVQEGRGSQGEGGTRQK